MRNTTQKTMRNWMFGLTAVAGLLGAGAAVANAQPIAFHERAGFDRPGFERPGFERPGYIHPGLDHHGFERPGFVRPEFGYVEPAYIPPSPGEDYFWQAGYYYEGAWIPGAWTFRGHRDFAPGYGRGMAYDQRFDRGRFDDRHFGGDHGFNRR